MSRCSLIATLALTALVASPVAFPAENHTKGATPIHISQGQTVTLADYLVPGKTTVFDFFSEYCPPCMRISPELEKLHARRADLAVVKVDINRPGHKGIDWQSPVARQYDLHSIPHFKIFGPDGKLMAEGDDAYEMVLNWIK
ncbi:MAG TPA: thioredoxin family protein [Opitutaceae bacterium]|nr:thioredoxin family protein [Opitutaceae bacterium]